MKKHLLLLSMVFAACAVMCTFTACGGGDDDDTINDEQTNTPSDGEINVPQGTIMLMQTCNTCSGSKQCVDCKGTGKGCKTCKGTGKYCSDCGGSGECDECYGSKQCNSCYGKKGTNCTWCMSKPGYCGKCVGTGKYGTAKCTSCNGTGRCYYCGGNYFTKCSKCNGTGECSHCHARGICPTCYGDPICSTCGGDGHCQTCVNSDGICTACKGSGEENVQSFAFAEEGGSKEVFIHCTSEWTLSSDADWLQCSRTSGKGNNAVTITIAKNPTTSLREGIVTAACGKNKATLRVSQTGEPFRLSVEQTSVFISSSGSSQTFTISSNTNWTIRTADPWLTCSPMSGSGNATVTVSASAYTQGTRYSLLTITNNTGEVTAEVSVAQAESQEALTLLKRMLEKPLGIVDVDLKTASYYTIQNETEKVYKVSANKNVNAFIVYDFYNPSLENFTYQGMTFSMFDYMSYRYNRYSKEERYITYVFCIDKSKPSDEYKTIRNNILQDFKYNLNVTLAEKDVSGNLESFEGLDADNYKYNICVRDPYRIDILANY